MIGYATNYLRFQKKIVCGVFQFKHTPQDFVSLVAITFAFILKCRNLGGGHIYTSHKLAVPKSFG